MVELGNVEWHATQSDPLDMGGWTTKLQVLATAVPIASTALKTTVCVPAERPETVAVNTPGV